MDEYKKKITAIYNGPHDITFKKKDFKRLKTITYRRNSDQLDLNKGHHFYLKDLEVWKVFDVNKYQKAEL